MDPPWAWFLTSHLLPCCPRQNLSLEAGALCFNEAGQQAIPRDLPVFAFSVMALQVHATISGLFGRCWEWQFGLETCAPALDQLSHTPGLFLT